MGKMVTNSRQPYCRQKAIDWQPCTPLVWKKSTIFFNGFPYIYRRLNANIYLSIIITFEQDIYFVQCRIKNTEINPSSRHLFFFVWGGLHSDLLWFDNFILDNELGIRRILLWAMWRFSIPTASFGKEKTM